MDGSLTATTYSLNEPPKTWTRPATDAFKVAATPFLQALAADEDPTHETWDEFARLVLREFGL